MIGEFSAGLNDLQRMVMRVKGIGVIASTLCAAYKHVNKGGVPDLLVSA